MTYSGKSKYLVDTYTMVFMFLKYAYSRKSKYLVDIYTMVMFLKCDLFWKIKIFGRHLYYGLYVSKIWLIL
jgi:hypothetical protein